METSTHAYKQSANPVLQKPIVVKSVGRRSVLFTEGGRKVTPEEAVVIARRICGHKRGEVLQQGPAKKKEKVRFSSQKCHFMNVSF